MQQILQNIKDGLLSLETRPPPALQPRGVCVRTATSLISAGTEKMLIDLAQKCLRYIGVVLKYDVEGRGMHPCISFLSNVTEYLRHDPGVTGHESLVKRVILK